MTFSIGKASAGFVAGALAVAVLHQGMYWAMKHAGMPLAGVPWNLAPSRAAFGMPTLANQMFWGGMWGVLFAVLYHRLPGGTDWLKGLLFGLLFPMLLGSWLAVAALKGQPLLAGFFIDLDPTRLRNGLLLNGVAFGVGLGIIYPVLQRALAGTR